MASDQVHFGIYAIEKKDYAELRCDHCKSITQLKALIRDFKVRGYKVRSNNGKMLKDAGLDAAEGALMSAA